MLAGSIFPVNVVVPFTVKFSPTNIFFATPIPPVVWIAPVIVLVLFAVDVDKIVSLL